MTTPKHILTVTQLNRNVRLWLEQEMGPISVEGEISNLSKPASGHFYFTLKDATAQIRCVYFRNRMGADDNRLENGQQVLIDGNLSLYEARGDYQLIVERLQRAGKGDLYRQFELLKAKLSALGLFEASRKRALPRFPKYIGIITSNTGAAIRDILSTLKRRYPIATLLIFASDVQGVKATQQLIQAINQANHDKRSDVIILARGGGSIEDLWAFNEEALAHAIANSDIPIVSGVGHETDFTIADFVADVRAATPTAAAEAVAPNSDDLMAMIETLESRLLKTITRFIQHQQLKLSHEMHKLTSPKRLISTYWQSLDYLRNHLQHALTQLLAQKQHLLLRTNTRLQAKNPVMMLQIAKSRLHQLEQLLRSHTTLRLTHLNQQLKTLMTTLHAVSPLATLDRGYAIVTHNKKVVLESSAVDLDDTIEIRLAKGHIQGTVVSKEDSPHHA